MEVISQDITSQLRPGDEKKAVMLWSRMGTDVQAEETYMQKLEAGKVPQSQRLERRLVWLDHYFHSSP